MMRMKAVYALTTLCIGIASGAGVTHVIDRAGSHLDWHRHESVLRDVAVLFGSEPFEDDQRVFPSRKAFLTSHEASKLFTHLVYSPQVGSGLLRWEDEGSHFIAWGYQLEPGTRKRGFVTTNLSIVVENDESIDWVDQKFGSPHGKENEQ